MTSPRTGDRLWARPWVRFVRRCAAFEAKNPVGRSGMRFFTRFRWLRLGSFLASDCIRAPECWTFALGAHRSRLYPYGSGAPAVHAARTASRAMPHNPAETRRFEISDL